MKKDIFTLISIAFAEFLLGMLIIKLYNGTNLFEEAMTLAFVGLVQFALTIWIPFRIGGEKMQREYTNVYKKFPIKICILYGVLSVVFIILEIVNAIMLSALCIFTSWCWLNLIKFIKANK